MAITNAQLHQMTARVNSTLSAYNAKIEPTGHFTLDRLNDLRNRPPIDLVELEDLFSRFIAQHVGAVLRLNHGDTFNIRCTRTHINMPCSIRKIGAKSGLQINVITIMRKQSFHCQDLHDFQVQ